MFKRLFAFIVGLVLLGGFAVADAGGKKGELVLRVATDFATFDQTDPALPPTTFNGGSAFYISGVICADGEIGDSCDSTIGTFHCWGWLIGPDQLVAVVLQYLKFMLKWKIT